VSLLDDAAPCGMILNDSSLTESASIIMTVSHTQKPDAGFSEATNRIYSNWFFQPSLAK
jgi:hypothetical protein